MITLQNPLYVDKVCYLQTVLLNQDTKHSIQHLFEYIMDEYVRLSALYDPTILKNNGIVYEYSIDL